MSSNTFGTLFRVTTFGESHGPALGCVVDGVPAGTLAYRPFRIEVPAGRRLEVRVVNTWPNRLIGDALRRSRGEEPFSWTNWPEAWRATDAPLPSGLLGPVALHPLLR